MQEIWRDIKNYEGCYQVSNLGNVRSLTRKIDTWYGKRTAKGKILKPLITNTGYLRVDLKQHQKDKYYSIHRLVAEAFIPNPNNYPIINHIDSNPFNNNVSNLEWCTQSYNVKQSYINGNAKPTAGCFKKGNTPHNLAKVNQYDLEGKFIATFISINDASQKTNTNRICIGDCCRNKQKTAGGFIWRYANK